MQDFACKFRHRVRHRAVGAAASVIAAALLFLSDAACAQPKTIKNVVPVPAGSTQDILSRLLADEIGRAGGPTIVIENRPGAGTALAAEMVAHAVPDGATLLSNASPFVINPQVRHFDYDALAFEPICYLARSPTMIVVNSASPYRTLADLLDAARARPRELTLAGLGPASAIQIAFEMLRRAARVDMTFVPYPGTTPALNALLGDHVTAVFGNYGDTSPQIKAGKLRPLALASARRLAELPDLPTIAESGYPEFEGDIWYGLVAPPRTPKDVVAQLAHWFAAAVAVPEIADKLAAQGIYPVGTCGAEFGAFMRKQFGDYGRIIREANIRAE